jgi:hypothetical protein
MGISDVGLIILDDFNSEKSSTILSFAIYDSKGNIPEMLAK